MGGSCRCPLHPPRAVRWATSIRASTSNATATVPSISTRRAEIASESITDVINSYIKLGSVLPDANMAWRNDFRWRNFNFGFMVLARLGGVVFSRTQAMLDYYGVSEVSAAARDAGGVMRSTAATWWMPTNGTRPSAAVTPFRSTIPILPPTCACRRLRSAIRSRRKAGRHLRNYLVARGAQPVDDLQQGSLRSRDRCDGEQLLPGHRLFHVAFDA